MDPVEAGAVPASQELSPAAPIQSPADVAIVSWSTGQGPRRFMATRNHVRYAARHGYAYRNGSDLEAAGIMHLMDPASWAKLYLVQAYLWRYAVVVWLDSDVFVAAPEVRVEQWVEEMGPKSMAVRFAWVMGPLAGGGAGWIYPFPPPPPPCARTGLSKHPV